MPSPIRAANSPRLASAFSLVELLVVIFIIAVVVAITLPALGGARDAAKGATSRALVQDISRASDQFYLDTRRYPGYFTPKEMGLNENGGTSGRGLSGMENLMLDLAGGIVSVGSSAPDSTTYGETVPAAPFDPTSGANADRVAWVSPSLIGAPGKGNSKAYFTPDAKNFVAQFGGARGAKTVAQFGQPGAADLPGKPQIPDVIDSFGNPLLVWTLDETASGQITDVKQFAEVKSDATSARFYWNQNAAFLRATALGRLKKNQALDGDKPYSLLGGGSPDDQLRVNLTAVLGNPGFPRTLEEGKEVLPTVARGKLIFQTAGADGFYLGDTDRGGKRAAKYTSGGRFLRYGMNFYGGAGKNAEAAARLKDKDGKDTNEDIVSLFDDVVVATGGS